MNNPQFLSYLAHTSKNQPTNEAVNLWKYEQNWTNIVDSLKITLIFQNSKLGWAGLYFSAVEYVNAFEQYTGCVDKKLMSLIISLLSGYVNFFFMHPVELICRKRVCHLAFLVWHLIKHALFAMLDGIWIAFYLNTF